MEVMVYVCTVCWAKDGKSSTIATESSHDSHGHVLMGTLLMTAFFLFCYWHLGEDIKIPYNLMSSGDDIALRNEHVFYLLTLLFSLLLSLTVRGKKGKEARQ